MKTLKLIVTLLLFNTCTLFASTPEEVEKDLLRSFKKIKKSSDNNDAFGYKLKKYAETYPSFIDMPLKSLEKAHMHLCTSADGLFRIYSWDTYKGGSLVNFDNLYQYKVGQKVEADYLIGDEQEEYSGFYSSIYTLHTGEKTYYLGINHKIFSHCNLSEGIKVFTIENSKLAEAPLIKKDSGRVSEISYGYNNFTEFEIDHIAYDESTKTIHFPLLDDKSQETKKIINYRFNGNYFEKTNHPPFPEGLHLFRIHYWDTNL